MKRLLLLFLLWPTVLLATPFEGRVVAVADGDTVTVLTADKEQVRVRLAQIDTPERGQPHGQAARQALATKVHQRTVEVEQQDIDRYGRVVGTLWLNGRDINRELVREGHAWVYRQYLRDRSLLEDEAQARREGRGLWRLQADQRIAPWEWRREQAQTRRKARQEAAPPAVGAEGFSCGAKRTCGEMSGCDEARFHLNRCGLTRLDGDGDGVPCEALCR